MDIKDYLLREYELKTRYLTDHLSRMWTRFNYFLVTETGIVSGKVIFSPQGQYNKALLWLGLVISVIWYLMGAQDRYLAELYRRQLLETFRQMKQENNIQEKPDVPLYHVGQVDGVAINVKSFPTSWRFKPISTTRLAAWIPLLATLFWAGWLLKYSLVSFPGQTMGTTTSSVAGILAMDKMSVSLDVAAAMRAILWPALLFIMLLIFRKQLPSLVGSLSSRLSKLEFAGFSLELAKAEPFVPKWSESAGALDLRHRATAIQITDSTARTFMTQLMETGTADYAEVNLGEGKEWLTSRLFIMSIIFARMKGIKSFVFVETAAGVRKQFVCWAEPAKIRFALARRYPWLEQAYAEAYSKILSPPRAFIISNQGRIGTQNSVSDPQPSIELLKEFLTRVQFPGGTPPLATETADWVAIDPGSSTQEHAHWLSSEQLEEILGNDCHSSNVRSTELEAKTSAEQLRLILATSERYLATTTDDRRFDYLIDRVLLLEQVAKKL